MSGLSDRDILEFSGFRIDPAGRRLTGPDGAAIVLKPKVFDTLAFLVARPGQVLDRHDFMDAVWPGIVVEENNLNQAISALRRALGDSHDAPRFIATVPGRGYQFVAHVRAVERTGSGVSVDAGSPPVDKAADRPASRLHLAAAVRQGWRRARLPALIGAAVVAALAAVALFARPQTPPPVVSIAVSPFADMSETGDQGYFADGVAEEIINRLDRVAGLRVIGRDSSFAAAAENPDPHAMGERLEVTRIVEGSVRKDGGRLRVTARLVDAADRSQLWSDAYDRELGSIFDVQDEIARAVVDSLRAELGLGAPGPALGLDYGGTDSVEALMHMMRARKEEALSTEDGLVAAAEELERALAIDPEYAQAWAERSIVLSMMLVGDAGDAELDREREIATQRALELTPDLPRAWVAAQFQHAGRREWVAAERANARGCTRALETTNAQLQCGGFLSLTGRLRRAAPYREAARLADPLSMGAAEAMMRLYSSLGMGEELRREHERADALEGDRWGVESVMLLHLADEGAPLDEIAPRLERACLAGSGAPPHCPVVVEALRSPDRAGRVLRDLFDSLREEGSPWMGDVAYWAAAVGDRELALDVLAAWIPSASSAQLQGLWYPVMSDVRADPRFKDIVRALGFVELWRTTGDWGDFCRPAGADDFVCS
jgi:TolB-like protein/DNA-binding winged helix-turn-helix (wHTH) protein